MFELYYKADKDNTTNTRLCCDIYDKDNNFVIDFIQYERSDFNKWSRPKVLTDLIVTRLYLPEIYSHISSEAKLKKYIKNNFDETFGIIEKFEDLAKVKHKLVISLPTSMYPHKRGIPTSARTMKDTHFPLIVSIDGQDVSYKFMDFGDFEYRAVETAYQALLLGKMPKSKNDIFYIDGIEALHEKICNNEMEN